MSVRIEGSDAFREAADRVALEGDERNVSVSDLFTDRFMQTHTDFDDIESFFRESPLTAEENTGLEQTQNAAFDRYVVSHTGFDSWESMLSAGVREWILRQDRD
jgi:hypothetical protein